jgi:predicted dienelactone hydrolase
VRAIEVLLPIAAVATALLTFRELRRAKAWRMPSARLRALRPPALLLAAGGLGAALILQLTLGGMRWQLVPVSVSGLLLVALLGVRAAGLPAPLVRGVAASTALAAALSSTLGWAFPVRVMPEPTGPYAVATTTIVLSDPHRTEIYGPRPGGPREIVVQLWYPAAPGSTDGAVRAALIPDAQAFAGLASSELGLPAFALGHLTQVRGSAVLDAPALTGALLPVVVLSHGWTGFRIVQADLAEQLASAGYVVAAPDHTYGALLTSFPDGRSVPLDPDALPDWERTPEDVYERRSRTLLSTFAGDLTLVLDTLDASPPAVLAGRLDPTKVAFLGHSTGGGASIAACAVTPRCAAVVGLDPWVEPVDPDVLRTGLTAPLLSLRTEDWTARPNEAALSALHVRQRTRGAQEGRVLIRGALHRDYTLIPALSPLGRLIGLEGATPASVTRTATLVWTQRFLDHHLRGIASDPLLDPPTLQATTLEGAAEPAAATVSTQEQDR